MMRISTFAEVAAQRRNLQALHALITAIGLDVPKPEQVLPVVVFMAFTVEAYVNNLGFRYVPDWSEKERKPWRNKVKLLHKNQNKTADWASPPLAFAEELFGVRDRLAHGKPERVEGPSFDCMGAAQDHIASSGFDPDWFMALDPAWYGKAKEQFYMLMEYLALLHNLSPADYFHSSINKAITHNTP